MVSASQGNLQILNRQLGKLVRIGLFIYLATHLGCQRLQLPAINPDGSSIFLPFPNTTQLQVPPIHSRPGQPGFLPDPAFKAPSAPPACMGGNCEPAGVCNLFHRKHDCLQKIHDHFRSAGKAGEIQLTPMRVVAPVGGEVVLLAGICGEDGYLVKREPIQWMLSPESVGQLIEVNDDAPGKLSSLLHPHRSKVEKLDVDFAKGRTSSKAQVIDRGTASCDDDIHLRDGETWVSISSPTAGVSRITALAPDSKVWDRRRQTAVIYWLDAQWQFPEPRVVKTAELAQLLTRVTKSEGFVPAKDWLVRYTLVDPTVGGFVTPTGEPIPNPFNSRVDENGIAPVYIQASPNGPGTTPVMIEVISPAQPDDHLPEIVVGRGQTFVTFSSPGLNLQATGPEQAITGDQVTYVATLGNPGDLNAENTTLQLILPSGLRFQSANLQPTESTDNRALWDQGLLPANRQMDIAVVAAALQPGTYEVVFEGRAAGIAPQRKVIRTTVSPATVDVRFEPMGGVSQAPVGEIVQYRIDVTNTGRQTLTNLKLKIEADQGLVEPEQSSNRVEQTIAALQPGETRTLGIPLRVQQEGQRNAKLTILSGGSGILAERSISILGLAPRQKRPDIAVDVQFRDIENKPTNLFRPGETNFVLVTLRNTGETALSGLNVEVQCNSPALEFTNQVDANNRSFTTLSSDSRMVTWNPPNMLASQGGDTVRNLYLYVRALSPTPVASVIARARAAEGVKAQNSAQIEVRSIGSVSPPVIPPENGNIIPPGGSSINPPMIPPSINQPGGAVGQLNIALRAIENQPLVNRRIRLGLRVENNSAQANTRVHIELLKAAGTRLLGIYADDGSSINYSIEGDRVLLPIIEYMRPGSAYEYLVDLSSNIPQRMTTQARVYSQQTTTPIETADSTMVMDAP